MYKLNAHNTVVRMSDGAYIPPTEGNSDYQQYLQWLSEGNTPEAADPAPVAVPPTTVVSAFQVRAALLQAGLLDGVEGYMALPGTDPFVKLAWDRAQDFRRDSPTVNPLADVLNLTASQLDDLFGFAKTITA